MLTLWAYVRYVEVQSLKSKVQSLKSEARSLATCSTLHAPCYYLLCLSFFVCGLLSKPTVVTLPFVLLLLDYWPLRRPFVPPLHHATTPPLRLLLEKLPFLLLAAGACVLTVLAEGEAIAPRANVSLSARLGNALVSYALYLRQMIWPAGLAAFYPLKPGCPLWTIALAFLVLALMTGGVWALARQRRWLWVGWLWYLGMLTPMIGLVQVSAFAHADRITYLPQIGLYLLLTWAVADLSAGWRYRRAALGGLAAIILGALIVCARTQTAYWRDSETLWTHALACTTGNDIAHADLGLALFRSGRVDEAMGHFQTAVQINPAYADGRNDLGTALLQKGSVDEAIIQYRKALAINPGFAPAHYNLGAALFQTGSLDEAIAHYQKALAINPGYADAHYGLGNALLQKGSMAEAIAHYQKALQIKPANPEVQSNLAWLLATCPDASLRDGGQAVRLARQANELTGGGNPIILHILAAAFAETGQFSNAVQSAQQAVQLAQAAGRPDLAARLTDELKRYQAGFPLHQ
jgi:tetratricopeptide (TPR) repeat protein